MIKLLNIILVRCCIILILAGWLQKFPPNYSITSLLADYAGRYQPADSFKRLVSH